MTVLQATLGSVVDKVLNILLDFLLINLHNMDIYLHNMETFIFGVDKIDCIPDVDECSKDPSPCDHICVNEPGSYSCRCRDNYTLDTDNISCVGESMCIENDKHILVVLENLKI